MDLSNITLEEAHLSILFLSILLLLVNAHIFGYMFQYLKLPRVIGEIMGGIILGPSGLGLIYPDLGDKLFNSFAGQGKILAFLYWFGLIQLMFCAGLQINKEFSFKDKKIILTLIYSSTILPLLGGLLYYYIYDFTYYKGAAASNLSMAIVVCISIAITSIPVISKIFMDLGIINSNFARIVLAASVLHDLILWVALDIAIKNIQISTNNIFGLMFITILFLLIALSLSLIHI